MGWVVLWAVLTAVRAVLTAVGWSEVVRVAGCTMIVRFASVSMCWVD